MADSIKTEGKAIEKGEYIIGIAIILAALLVSGTVFMGMNSVTDAIGKVKLTVTAAPSGGSGTTPTPTPTPTPTVPTVQQLSGLDYSTAPFRGSASADLVMAEYSDFQCPYCGNAEPTMVQLQAAYPNMKFIYRQFPLSFHPYAQKAAEASLCANAQGKFWELHDKMYANQNSLAVSDIKGYAAAISGMNATAFNTCLDSGTMAAEVSKEEQEGVGIGIQGTPSFLIYSKSVKSDALEAKLQALATKLQTGVVQVNGAGYGIVVVGALPYANFQEVMSAFN
ncbi:MAG: DsbA family protein [Candidatus Micrarchaeota archaeon]|nr:DsbA family protein [Candidatus Micrarchaeota archaeon]